MTPNPKPERSSGEFRRATQSLPAAVVVDGSGWKRKPGPRTTGEFVSATKSLPAAVVVDGSEWVRGPLAALAEQLTAALATLPADQRVTAVEQLVRTVSEAHCLPLTVTRKTA